MPDSVPDPTLPCQVLPIQPYGDPLPGILPLGGISLLAGAPNIGKTSLLAGVLKAIRDQVPIFGHQPSPVAGIGYINADRGWEKGSGIWFERAGYPEILQYSMADDPQFNPKRLRKKHERTDILASFIDGLKLPPYSLLCIDPIALFLGGNLLSYDECAVACHEIRVLLRERRYTLLATAHSAKLKADKKERYIRLQDQVLGSTAISGFTDTMMYLASPQEVGKPYFMLLWHPHAAPAESIQLEQDDQGLFIPYQGKNPHEEDGTIQRILALIPADGEVIALGDIIELAAKYPISKPTVKRVLNELLDEGRIVKPIHGYYARAKVQ